MDYKNLVATVGFGKATGLANTGSSLVDMKVGDILIINAATGAVVPAGEGIDKHPVIQVATCTKDGVPTLSGEIVGKGVDPSTKYYNFLPRKIGNMVVGFKNGVSATTIPTFSVDTELSMSVIVPRQSQMNEQRQYRRDVHSIGLGGFDGASELVRLLSDSGGIMPKEEELFPIAGDVLVDGTSAAVATITGSIGNGSNRFVMSATTGLAIGDIIKINLASSDSGAGEDISGIGGAFKIVDIDGNNVVLDRKYWGIAQSGVGLTKYTAVTKVGITLFPRAAQTYDGPVAKYNQVGKFEVGLSETFGGLVPFAENDPILGEGYGWQLRDKEVAYMGYEGYSDRRNVMSDKNYVFQATPGVKYDQISIASNKEFNKSLLGSANAAGGVLLAFPEAVSTQRTAVSAILTPWLLSAGVTVTW